jgi:Aldehyde dehydrogenase family
MLSGGQRTWDPSGRGFDSHPHILPGQHTVTRCPWTPTKEAGFDQIGFTGAAAGRDRRDDHPFQLPGPAGATQDSALAAGTAFALAACFVDAGLPEGVLSVFTGPGGVLGDALMTDPRLRKVSLSRAAGPGHPQALPSHLCSLSRPRRP